MKKELTEKLNSLKKEFGDVDGIILTREAFHACNPENDKQWKCDAIKIDDKIASTGWVYWDFSNMENYDEIEDAGDYTWENATAEDFDTYEEYDLTDDADLADLLDNI